MNIDEAQTFVEMTSKSLDTSNRLSRCIDGRYEGLKDFPLLAKPGADAGDVMTAFGAMNNLQLSLSSESIVNAVLAVIGGAQNFSFHTDDHSDPADFGFGCEHIKLAKDDPTTYGVTQEQIDFIFSQLPVLLEQGAKQEVLHGDHAEQAVIVVDSHTHGLVPLVRVGENLHEAFIYQRTLHTEQLDQLARNLQEALAADGQAVEEPAIRKALSDAFGKQLAATLKVLAGGLPIYTAMIDAEGAVSIASE